MLDNKLQELADLMRNQKIINQFAQENDMVLKKHILSKSVLSYYAILSDIERLEKQPVSVKRDTLVNALYTELETPLDTFRSVIEEALIKEKALVLQVSKIKDDLEIALEAQGSLQKANMDLRRRAAIEENKCISFVYSSKVLTFLFQRSLTK